jgi:NADPH-dependent glutamate synthase beta subunit-like oxidoreductase
VALDAARILLKGYRALETTDITQRTLELLKKSTIDEIHLFGRRGPAQASFTNKELREMFDLEGCQTIIAKEDLSELNSASVTEIASSRQHKRMIEMMQKKATLLSKKEIQSLMEEEPSGKEKKCFVHFHSNPVAYLPSKENESRLGGLIIEKTKLVGDANCQSAVGTGEQSVLRGCGMSLESIGYFPLPIPGIPFNDRGALHHDQGRVLLKDGTPMEGMYASGWFKRGPSGIIGTNVWDAQETSRSLIEDLVKGRLPLENRQPFYQGISDLIDEKTLHKHTVSWKDWMTIEQHEEHLGSTLSPPKPREKLLTSSDMLQILQTRHNADI